MMSSRKHRILSAIGAVLCPVSMIVSVTVLPAMAYANVTKNPLFSAVLSAVVENNRGQNKSGEGGAKGGSGNSAANGEAGKKEGAKGETAKGDKGDKGDKKAKEVDKKEGKRNDGAANGAAGNESKGGGVVDNSNAGKDASKIAGKGAGKDASKDAVKSGKSDKNADKASKKDSKDANKAKGKDRSAGDGEKLSLEEVKKLPACVANAMVTSGETIETLSIEPPSGADKCCLLYTSPSPRD